MPFHTTTGDPVQQSRNIAARAGRWSAQHRKTAIFGWLAFVIAAFAIGSYVIGNNTLTKEQAGVGESGRADVAAFNAFPKKADEAVLIHHKTLTADSPQFKAAVADVVARLKAATGVQQVDGPLREAAATRVSPDNHSALVAYELPGDAVVTKKSVEVSLAATEAAARANPGFRIDAFGSASTEKEFMESPQQGPSQGRAHVPAADADHPVRRLRHVARRRHPGPARDLRRARARWACSDRSATLSPVSDSINSVVLLIGLAVGVDYALFYIRREREEREAGRSPEAALEAAAATSGRAILISGFTVMTAMSGMYLAGAADFRSYATGTIVVVAMAMLGSVTVLPALLSKLGNRAQKRGRVGVVSRLKAKVAAYGLWGRVVDRVLKRPLVSAVVSGGLMLALALPALGLHLAPRLQRLAAARHGRRADVRPRQGCVPERGKLGGDRRRGR